MVLNWAEEIYASTKPKNAGAAEAVTVVVAAEADMVAAAEVIVVAVEAVTVVVVVMTENVIAAFNFFAKTSGKTFPFLNILSAK